MCTLDSFVSSGGAPKSSWSGSWRARPTSRELAAPRNAPVYGTSSIVDVRDSPPRRGSESKLIDRRRRRRRRGPLPSSLPRLGRGSRLRRCIAASSRLAGASKCCVTRPVPRHLQVRHQEAAAPGRRRRARRRGASRGRRGHDAGTKVTPPRQGRANAAGQQRLAVADGAPEVGGGTPPPTTSSPECWATAPPIRSADGAVTWRATRRRRRAAAPRTGNLRFFFDFRCFFRGFCCDAHRLATTRYIFICDAVLDAILLKLRFVLTHRDQVGGVYEIRRDNQTGMCAEKATL